MNIINRKLSPAALLIVIIFFAAVLRLYNLGVNPPSLFGDELDVGYQAYSILKTGKDYQGNFMPLNFRSIAEWRSPLYLYSAVPTVAVFGISPWGVRLPAAIFGILSVAAIYFLAKELVAGKDNLKGVPILSAFLMAVSPWSLQYSRAGFEVTEMLFFLISGIYLFFRSFKEHKYLTLSVVCLMLTPWIYSTAKLFTLWIIIFFTAFYRKEILAIGLKQKAYALLCGLILGLPLVYATFYGGGAQRINDISIFNDPNMEQIVGAARQFDQMSQSQPLLTKLVNNKYTYFSSKFIENYLKSFSTEFLFIKGDLNLRQSVGWGQLYMIEFLVLIAGTAILITGKLTSRKETIFTISYLLISPIPFALTSSSGGHATRLILMLPALVILISAGWVWLYGLIPTKIKKAALLALTLMYMISLGTYLHRYYYSYKIVSAKWWHYGWEQAIKKVKEIEPGFDRVIVSMSGEPAWIFFAGYYEYPPQDWQNENPFNNTAVVDGFGEVSKTGKFYFGSPTKEIQVFGLGDVIDKKTLYLANAAEIGSDLEKNPEKTPPGLKLINTVKSVDGLPLFFIFSGEK